jgi:hypothetical protein
MPTLAKNSQIFCVQAGRFLTLHEKAFLMGFHVPDMQFPQECSKNWFRERLGLSIHVASLGTMLLALIATPLGMLTNQDR